MRIKLKSCFSSNLSNKPEENIARFIDVANSPIFTGGQGKIYEVIHIDGKRVSELLVKIFNRGFPSNLREIITAVRDNKDKYKIDRCIALRALPLFLFEGQYNNEQFYGHVMRRAAGESFNKIIEDDINAYINLSLEDRLQLCFQFVEGMHILYCLTIVHADLNGQNLIIDRDNKRLAIIDLDGGAVAKTGLTPAVIGKLEPGWLDPEIVLQLSGTTLQQTVNVKITADLWSISCGVHHLLFGIAPFFFIAKRPEIKRYLQNHEWPQLRGIKGITTRNDQAFDYYESAYNEVPELHKFLKICFQGGYLNPGQRIGAYQWMQAIKGMLGDDIPELYQPVPAPVPAPDPVYVICPHGHDNETDEIYCQDEHCALPLHGMRTCPKCKSMTPIKSFYCTNCGHKL